jgi:hypothetical protein
MDDNLYRLPSFLLFVQQIRIIKADAFFLRNIPVNVCELIYSAREMKISEKFLFLIEYL